MSRSLSDPAPNYKPLASRPSGITYHSHSTQFIFFDGPQGSLYAKQHFYNPFRCAWFLVRPPSSPAPQAQSTSADTETPKPSGVLGRLRALVSQD